MIDKFINEKLAGNPLVAMMLSGDMMTQIKDMFKKELEDLIPEFLESVFFILIFERKKIFRIDRLPRNKT